MAHPFGNIGDSTETRLRFWQSGVRLEQRMVGRSVSGYEILGKAGEGGMGVVYRARDQRLGREVALKFLSAELLGSREARLRFQREARTISALNHPNIATLFSFEESPDGAFLAFEYLPGGTLSERLPRRQRPSDPIPLPQALQWSVQIAEALAHAHRRGIVHRDIKPGNVLFDEEDRPKLSDFGLAKAESGDPGVTRSGMAVGTAAYMAPEQVVGAGGDFRSDIFSFGVLLYELFTGRRPFSNEDPRGVFYGLLHETPEAPAALQPGLPPALSEWILACLARDPAQRPATMDQVAGALRQVLAEAEQVPTDATRTFVAEVPPRSASIRDSAGPPDSAGSVSAPARPRRRTWMQAAALVLLLALAGIPIRAWLWDALPWNALPDERKVAVLLVENLNGGAEQEAFCAGLTDSLTAMITQMSQGDRRLWVVPASEVRAGNVRSIRDARSLFAVNLALTGSLRRLGQKVIVTLSLADAEAGRQLESRSLEVDAAALSQLEGRMLEAVSAMLRAAAPARATAYAQPQDIAAGAYELCMQGRGFLQRFDLPGNLDRAQAAFEQALVEEPRYALAHASLGETFLARHSLTQDSQWLPLAKQATERAVELSPRLGAAHVNLCLLYTRTSRFEEAILEGQLARDLDPLHAEAYRALALAYSSAGRTEEAERTYQQAISLQPGFWLPYKDLGVHYLNSGRFADAEAMFRSVIEKTPDNEWGYRNLATACHFTGRLDEAEQYLRAALARKETGESYSNLGSLFYVQRRYADAAEAYQKAAGLSPNDPIVWGNLGDAWRASVDTRAQAPAVYEKAIALGERQLAIHAKDPQLLLGLALYAAKLGNHPRAAAYLKRAEPLSQGSAAFSYQAAIVHELAGERQRSLEHLRRALALGYPLDEIRSEPELRALQGDTEYQRILASVRR